MRIFSFLAMAGALAAPSVANATDIVQLISISHLQVQAFGPLVQSFTAVDSEISAISLNVGPMNPTFSQADPLLISLFGNINGTGPALASFSYVVPVDYNGFYDFSFVASGLAIGTQYSFAVSTIGSSPYLGLRYVDTGFSPDAYSGGELRVTDIGIPIKGDLAFKVLGGSMSAVPEPASWAMMIMGFGAVAAAMRRKRQAVQVSFC